uniref:WRKY19-like zinc finger domain-containing protein n=1 Tax=Globisporangium ultimum (strain ATCC 200006 / CBS 805.95 / DAOM BR144) TaxID=431595 RepID=K3WF04_GLOUD
MSNLNKYYPHNSVMATYAVPPTASNPLAFSCNKAALSFILSSSSSEDSDSFQAPVVPTTNVIKRKRMRPTASQARGVSPTASSAAIADANAMKKGSKFCIVDGCMSRAKHAKRCWRHGGSVKCKVSDCDNRAKSKGVCWSHGGGTICSFERCDTISVSNGFCWAHGGGKRCAVPNCSKPAYERTQNYCTTHYDEILGLQPKHMLSETF